MSAFAHYELNTSDSAAAKEFYHSVLGWKPQDMPMPGGVYTMLQSSSGPVAGLLQNPVEGTPSQWLAYTSVSSAEQTLAKATENGATAICPVTEIPGMGKYAVFVDPQGAALGIWEAAEKPKPAKKAAKKSSKKTAKKAAKKSSKKSAKKAAKKSSKKTAKKAAKKSSKKSAKKAAKKSSRKAAKKSSRKAAKKTAKKSSRKTAKKAAKKSSRKATKKAAKKSSRKTAKKAAKKSSRRK